jgi:4-amino-4-deoxy-L-arabinose transferase-like glycosyltransferase
VTRGRAYAVVAAAAALPRLAALAVERGQILEEFTEKSDDFARNLVETGSFGLIPGEPSAYTQPLYGWFLAAIYWVDRHWLLVGLVQIGVAVATAWLVYEIGRRVLSGPAALVAALVAALNPYLIWHDVHVNREILDSLLAAALVLVVLLAAERRSAAWAGAAGGLCGLAILGNARLVLLPLVVIGFLAWRRVPAIAAGAVALATVLVVTPWVVRNRVEVGCFALTTDSRALWKANNEHTYDVLAKGGWIDDVPRVPGSPPTPEEAAALLRVRGERVEVDECEQMSYYRELVTDFWRDEPAEKGKLAVQAAGMLWDPRVTRTESRSNGFQGTARTWIAPLYFVPLYLLALAGLPRVPRSFAVLTVALLGYVTLAALVFAGATRYRASWDFLLALLAAPVLLRLLRRER